MFGSTISNGAASAVTPIILQPIVADRQQLIRADRLRTLQPMVVIDDKDRIKALFSKRLNELLDESGAPDRGRRQWLARKFNGAFSSEAARKWLEGETMPDQPHLAMLCTAFGWGVDFLMTGAGPRHTGKVDPGLTEIINDWPTLDAEGRKTLLRQFRNERDMHGLRPQPPSTPPASSKGRSGS